MSLKRRNDPRARMQQRFLVFIGVILIASMLFSLLLPLFQTMVQNQAVIQPTPSPAPTVPAPIANLSGIAFDRIYLHPSGLFTVGIPTGWTPSTSNTTETEAQVTLQNGAQLSVAEVRLIKPAEPVAGVEDIGSLFTESWIQASWSTYRNAQESVRTVEGDRLIIDFSMEQGSQEYIARQIATTDGTYVYVARLVTPPNASEMLQYVLEGMNATIQLVPEFAGSPFGWNAYHDTTVHHIIRFPRSWQVVDAEPGLPATIEGSNTTLRVETLEGAATTEAEATARVEALRSGIEVLSVKPVERDGMTGFQVAYRLVNQDGDAESGAAVLLNGADEKLHVASLRLTDESGVDLNADTAAETNEEALNVLNSFTVLPDLNVYVAPEIPTPAPGG